MEYQDLPRLIDERATAFRTAVAAAPDLDVQVSTCPEWTLADLVRHLGTGRRVWAATIAAGPAATARATLPEGGEPPQDREALLAWLAESVELLLAELRAAAPDRRCWSWWDKTQTPLTCAAVARRQLHEVAVHAYDAQVTIGAAQPVPSEVAADGIEEFLWTFGTTTEPWPHKAAIADYYATEGRSWRQWLDADGARVGPVPATDEVVDASMTGSANDLLLALYGRVSLDSLAKVADNGGVFDQLAEWDPER